jgi:osmotically-inducible protein OsmY
MNVILKIVPIALLTCTLVGAANNEKTYRPDPWITTKTKIALLTSTDVPGRRVNVDTVSGRVTLHGTVATTAEKTRAGAIAKQIEGATDVRNLLQVVPDTDKKVTKLEDAVVRNNAETALKSDAALSGSKIHVQSVNKGVVLLAGTADSLSAHLRAIRDVAVTDGVVRVASEVKSPDTMADQEIRRDEITAQSTMPASAGGVGQAFKDMWISTDVKMRLMADGDTPAMSINVDTKDGVVTLFGIVPTIESKQAAGADVAKVSGVTRVDNALEVVAADKQAAGEVRDDDAVKASEGDLRKNGAYDDVSVDVKNGVARLTGTVSNQSDWLMAAVSVRSSRGINSVNNDLTVKRH